MHGQRIEEEVIQQMKQATGEQAPHCTPAHLGGSILLTGFHTLSTSTLVHAAPAPRRQVWPDCVPPETYRQLHFSRCAPALASSAPVNDEVMEGNNATNTATN